MIKLQDKVYWAMAASKESGPAEVAEAFFGANAVAQRI
jgi:hypothetical protein